MGLVINFLSLVIDLNGVYIKIIKLEPNVHNSYLLVFIHKFILFALTTNAILIFIMYLYMYLLNSVFIGIDCGLLLVKDIYFNCISIEFIGLVFIANFIYIYVSLRFCVQNRRTKWNFLPNYQTMRKLSDLYSRIFQTQSSGCASGVNYFRNFTKLKNLNF